MNKNPALFEIIKSLDNNEKRYFTMYASRHTIGEKNNALKLFEEINKQKQYDEKKLMQLFAGTSIGKNFRVNKQYLFSQILKSMRAYRSDMFVDMQLKGLLSDVEFLIDKGLYKPCEKIIAKAKKLAYQYYKFSYILEILKHEILVLFNVNPEPKNISKKNDELHKEEQQILQKLNNINFYRGINSQIIAFVRNRGIGRTSDEISPFENILKHPLLLDENKDISFHEKRFFYEIHASYYYVKGDVKSSCKYHEKLLQHIESHPHIIDEQPRVYIIILCNLLILKTLVKEYSSVFLLINKLKSLQPKSKVIQADLFNMIYINQFFMNRKLGTFKEGIAEIDKVKEGIMKFSKYFIQSHLSFFYYNIASVYFGAGMYKEALAWVNKVLNDTRVDIKEDIHCFSRILHMLIHYELDNLDLIEYLKESTSHFLDKKHHLYLIEETILDFFKKELPKVITNKNKISVFKKLKTQIEKALKDPYEEKALEYFDFISWLESKIEGRAFAEVVREKAIQA